MARSHGIDVALRAGIEGAYGTPPVAGTFFQLPLVSTTLGAEQGLLEDDQLGTGREGFDPVPDVVNNDGDIVVPVDTRAIGRWLKLLFGAPVTTGAGPTYTHVFTSGAAALPSMSVEVGHPSIPAFFNNFGVVGNTLRIAMARTGMLNATIGCIAQGESEAGISLAPAAALQRGVRFAQATGEISKDGVHLGGTVSADFTFSNNFEKVESIRPDGMIDGADPLKVTMGGSIGVRFADLTLYNAAIGTPVVLNFGWQNGTNTLVFSVSRVFLPKVKRPVSGPGGILATFAWQGSGGAGHVVTATLVNDVASYAT